MKLYHTLNREVLHNMEFSAGTVVLIMDGKTELVCSDFTHSRKGKMGLYVWIPAENRWVTGYAQNEYTEIIWAYHRKIQRRYQRKHRNHIDYGSLMRHDRKHKKGGGGRIGSAQTVTDYECVKIPLHDFRRCYN